MCSVPTSSHGRLRVAVQPVVSHDVETLARRLYPFLHGESFPRIEPHVVVPHHKPFHLSTSVCVRLVLQSGKVKTMNDERLGIGGGRP